LATAFGFAATIVVLVTVCALPWIHGGTIPLARLVLQVGACSAGLLSFISGLLNRSQPGFPRIVFPLGMLVCVGLLQLLPMHAPLVTQMNHAVQAELRYELPEPHPSVLTLRSGSPADTRTVVAQIVALMLLAMTAYDQIRSQRAVRLTLAVFTSNALVFSLLALAQEFRGDLFLIRDEWWTGLGGPFGSFVNGNNAAGWLSMGLAAAIGLLFMQFRTTGSHRLTLRGAGPGLLRRIIRYVAGLTAGQVATWCSVILIACAIVATRSRGAMIAIGLSFLVLVLLRSRPRYVLGTVAAFAVAVLGLYAVARLLSLDELATRELRTLYDPVHAISPRIAHWKDSLGVALDFPVLGAGLGAYRFITLPYQSQGTGAWFQHADNQYVEFVVESGITGLIAFVLVGLPILISSSRVVRSSVYGGAGAAEESVALILVFATVTQGIFSLFDFGPALPASSSLFVVLVSILTAIQAEHAPGRKKVESSKLLMQLALVVGGVVFVSDLAAAQQCYLVSIDGRTVCSQEISEKSLDDRVAIIERAKHALAKRADDPEAHETVSRLSRDLLRAEFMKGLPGIDQDGTAAKIWPYTSCMAIVRRIDGIDEGSELRQHLQSVYAARLSHSGIIEHCRRVRRDIPVGGSFLRRAATWARAAQAEPTATDLSLFARFSEPANTGLGLQLGELAMRQGAKEEAMKIFSQVLRAESSCRGSILQIYASNQLLDEGFEVFGPRSYTEAVVAMRGQAAAAVIERLNAAAVSLWVEPVSVPSMEDQLSRCEFFARLQDFRGQAEWLQRCVDWNPNHVNLHTDLAIVLGQLGRLDDALVEWHEVLRIQPDNLYAQKQARRTAAAIQRRVKSGK